MIKNISPLERMLLLSVLFNMLLLLVRFYFTKELTYGFYIWNTFLAILPLLFSRALYKQQKLNYKAIILLAFWLLFFPNAPYIITDLFHYDIKPPIPQWYDLLIVVTAAWNGLLLGIVSLMQVEQFLLRHLKAIWVKSIVIISFLLCGYGVYIGRFLRFNSWDLVINPIMVLSASAHHVFQPFENRKLWAFTVLFGVMFGIIYYTLQQLSLKKQADVTY